MKGRTRPLIGLGFLALLAWALWHGGGPLFRLLGNQERMRDWLAGFGPLAPLVSVVSNVLQVLLAPVPGQVIALANGYLFGVFWGTVYSLVGVTLGSALAMGLGRWLGRPAVERLVDERRLARWDALMQRRGSLFFFLIFLLPLLPDDIICFVVGLGPLSLLYALGLATIGRLPGLIVASWLGSRTSLSPGGWVALISGALLLGMIYLRYYGWFEERVVRWAWGGTGDRRVEFDTKGNRCENGPVGGSGVNGARLAIMMREDP